MEGQETGTGFNNIAGGIGSIISALAGSNGIGDDIAAVTGNPVPQSVAYVQAPQQSASPSLIWILMGGALIVVLVLVLKK